MVSNKKTTTSSGFLIMELLVSVAVLAVIAFVGAQASLVSFSGGKASEEKDNAANLSNEVFEAVRAAADEKWVNLYNLTKGGTQYHPALSGGKWTLVANNETITLNNISYTRYFTVDNVSRDITTRNIESAYVSADDDPSTQKVTVTVTWPGGSNNLTISQYVFRWRNKVCDHTDWLTSGSSGAKTCPDSSYDVKDSAVDASTSLLIK
jgi:type II secretory pathway pseudopilin PulG